MGRSAPNGFRQGFSESWVTPATKRRTDESIVDWTIARLDRARDRFFGWVFFISPHWIYEERQPPTATSRDRYRQEIAHADAQLGRLFDHLRASAMLDRTIVIITSDHGEEFLEHGKTSHKATVYEEVIHTPLVVWIPGVKGRVVVGTTSTLYIFPWLWLSASDSLAATARRVIHDHLAPMIKATDGAVITELIGWDRMKTALVWRDKKIIIDMLTGRRQIFDRESDAAEQHDLSAQDTASTRNLDEAVRHYRAQRACNSRIKVSLIPYLPADPEHGGW